MKQSLPLLCVLCIIISQFIPPTFFFKSWSLLTKLIFLAVGNNWQLEKHCFRPTFPKSGATSESLGVLVKYIYLCSLSNLQNQNFFSVRPKNLYFLLPRTSDTLALRHHSSPQDVDAYNSNNSHYYQTLTSCQCCRHKNFPFIDSLISSQQLHFIDEETEAQRVSTL